MRITLSIDSATAAEAEAFVYSFQRAGRNLMLDDTAGSCTVQMMGAWHVQTPPITPHHGQVMAEDFFGWLNEKQAAVLNAILDPPPTVSLVKAPEETP